MDAEIVSRPTEAVKEVSQGMRELQQRIVQAGRLTYRVAIVEDGNIAVYTVVFEDSPAGYLMTAGAGDGNGNDSMTFRSADMSHLMTVLAAMFAPELVDAVLA